MPSKKPTGRRNGRPPPVIERLAKRNLTTYLSPPFHEALRLLADEQECSLQYLSEMALVALLRRHGKPVPPGAREPIPEHAAAVAAAE